MSLPAGWTPSDGGWSGISSASCVRKGTCVFLNSHLLSEIEVTCDRVAFIRNGEVIRVIEMSAVDEGQATVTIRARGMTPEICSGLAAWGQDIRADGEHLSLNVRSEESLPEITRFLVEKGVQVYQITPQRLSLEELFIETVGKDAGL